MQLSIKHIERVFELFIVHGMAEDTKRMRDVVKRSKRNLFLWSYDVFNSTDTQYPISLICLLHIQFNKHEMSLFAITK